MCEWAVRRLSDVVSLPSGQVNPTLLQYSGQILIAPDHVESGTGRLLELRTAADQGASSGKYIVKIGDVVYSKIRPALRKAVLAEFEGLCSADMYPMTPSAEIDSRYLLAVLLSESFSRFAESVSGRSGIPKINRRELEEFSLPLPPIDEQRRIAEILDSIDDQIRCAEVLIKKEELLEEGVMSDLFGTTSGDEYQFSDISSPERGSMTIGPFGSNLVATDYRDSGVPVVFVQDLRDGSYKNVSNVYVSTAKARQLIAHSTQGGDLLLTKMGLPPCVAAVYPPGSPGAVITADIIRVRPDRSIVNPEWLACAVNHERFRSQVRGITGGVTRPKVTLRDVRSLKLMVPSLTKQQEAMAVIGTIRKRRVAAQQVLNKFQLLKQGLIDDLLAGRVRVPAG